MNKRLHVVVATHAEVGDSVTRLHQSIRDCLAGWDVATRVLVFSADGGELDTSSLPPGLGVFHTEPNPLPIVESRNLCQRYLRRLMEEEGGYGLVLDDDLVWTISAVDFEAHISHLLTLGADMAFLGLTGDPPIPKEYTRASPLLDALLTLSTTAPIHQPLERFLNGVRIGSGEVEHSHHDLYAFNTQSFAPHEFRLEIGDFIERLFVGKATTRPPTHPSEIVEATGRERGGATLILNSEVLALENTAQEFGGVVSRRSDMLMAVRAKEYGFKLCSTPPMLEHSRQFGHDSRDPDKLIGDIAGFALLQHMQGRAIWSAAFTHRAQRTSDLLRRTNDMVHLLRDVAEPDEGDCHTLERILNDNYQVLEALSRFMSQELQAVPGPSELPICLPEPSRVSRRLQPLRTWSHEQVKPGQQVFAQGP